MADELDTVAVRTTRAVITKTVTLDDKAIRRLVSAIVSGIPDNARVSINLPGGGDWSNCTLDVEAAHPITIEWTETEVEVS